MYYGVNGHGRVQDWRQHLVLSGALLRWVSSWAGAPAGQARPEADWRPNCLHCKGGPPCPHLPPGSHTLSSKTNQNLRIKMRACHGCSKCNEFCSVWCLGQTYTSMKKTQIYTVAFALAVAGLFFLWGKSDYFLDSVYLRSVFFARAHRFIVLT